MRYQIIYADPPWDYGNRLQHNGAGRKTTGGAATWYPTMTHAELKQMDVPKLSEPTSCLLFLWVTGPKLAEGLELMASWEFEYVTVAFVWDKVEVNPGNYTMSQCEWVLLGKRGSIPKPRGERAERQLVTVKRAEHSEKPLEVRTRIERMFPSQRKVELFARQSHSGWDALGNEVAPTLFDREPRLVTL